MNELKRPSSTITAATLTGMGMTLLTEITMQIGIDLRPTLVAAAVTFASAAVGYFKRENVLPIARADEHEDGVA